MGIKYMLFEQPGKKYMTNGNKIYDFLTVRSKIYDRPIGIKSTTKRNKIYAFLIAMNKIYAK